MRAHHNGREPSSLTLDLDPTIDQIPVARRFVLGAVRQLGGPTHEVVLDDLALVASEAITNAVQHARTTLTVTVTRSPKSVRVSVHDDDEAPIPRPRAAGSDEVGGRGLLIIDALAKCWGVESIEGDGKDVWFELDT